MIDLLNVHRNYSYVILRSYLQKLTREDASFGTQAAIKAAIQVLG